MDRVLWNVPKEIKKLILSFCRLDVELRERRLALRRAPSIRPYLNRQFWMRWSYLESQMGDEDYYVIDNARTGVIMLIRF